MRVTETEVLEIMDGCTLQTTEITPFIIAAEEVITNVFNCVSNVSDTLLKEIERWYTAHLVASTKWRQEVMQEVDDVRVQYGGKYGVGLDFTPYGQTVKTLDPTGKMANLGKQSASIYAVKSFS